MKILFGPAGSPAKSSLEGVQAVKEMGLRAMEVEFTYGVRMSNALAKEIGVLAKKLGIELSVHAPYYINLASADKAKLAASKQRILMSCERANYLGAKYVVFHAGFYGKLSKEECYDLIKKQIVEIQKKIKAKKWNVKLAPETTGKGSQFGSLDELVKFAKEIKCTVCVDFAHIKARQQGKIDYKEVFDKVKFIKHLHTHHSGIEYTAKGERRHLIMKNSDIMPLLKEIKKRRYLDITIISESPVTWKDALKMKKIWEKL